MYPRGCKKENTPLECFWKLLEWISYKLDLPNDMEKHLNKMGSVKFIVQNNSIIIWLKSLGSKNSMNDFSIYLRACENATQLQWIFLSIFGFTWKKSEN